MRLAFVFVPYHHKLFSENLRVVDEDFGVFPPINLAYAAAIAERAGHRVLMVDANSEHLTPGDTISRLRAFGAEAVGFYFSTYMFHDTLSWAKAIKEALRVPILGGGINLQLYPIESMTHPVIDYGVIGQAVNSLPKLLEALEARAEPDVTGICYRRNGEIVVKPPDTNRTAFDSYPFPARHLLPNERYHSITSQLRNFTIMVTSMGCHQGCSFCSIAPMPVQHHSPGYVLEEIQECVQRFGVREIDIFDADFTVPRQRAEAICHGILDRGIQVEWSCRTCVDSVDADLLRLMARAGCRKIYLGIETPDERSLKHMNKKISVSKVRPVVAASKRAGIRPLGFFMTGVPGETRRSLINTIRFALNLGLDYAQFSRTIAKPGSALNRELAEARGKDYWHDYVLGVERERRVGSPWTMLSEGEIEKWTKIAYLSFYFRPSFVLRTLRKLRSLDELRRGVRTAIRMGFAAFTRE